MKRSYMHLLLDGLMALCGLGLVLTGLLIEFVLPAGSRQTSVWGMTRHDWGTVHFWFALVALGLVGLHLVMNWGWVCAVVAKMLRINRTRPTVRRQGWTGAAALLLLTLLTGGFLYAAQASKVLDTDRGGHRWQQVERGLDRLFLMEAE